MKVVVKSEATKIAEEYAAENGYSGVRLLKNDYKFDNLIDTFAFSLESKPKQGATGIPSVGLPEVLLIEKVTGTAFREHLLI